MTSVIRALYTRIFLIAPLFLYCPASINSGLPGTDVPNLAVLIVIPATPRYGVSYGLTYLMSSHRCKRVQHRHAPCTACTVGIRQHSVVVLTIIRVIATKLLARCILRVILYHYATRPERHKQRLTIGARKHTTLYIVSDELLYLCISHRGRGHT